MFCRLQSMRTPLVLRIPLAAEGGTDQLQDVLERWQALMSGNDDTLRGSAAPPPCGGGGGGAEGAAAAPAAPRVHSTAEKTAWWERRRALDAQVSDLPCNVRREGG